MLSCKCKSIFYTLFFIFVQGRNKFIRFFTHITNRVNTYIVLYRMFRRSIIFQLFFTTHYIISGMYQIFFFLQIFGIFDAWRVSLIFDNGYQLPTSIDYYSFVEILAFCIIDLYGLDFDTRNPSFYGFWKFLIPDLYVQGFYKHHVIIDTVT